MRVSAGTSGYSYKEWKGAFYPSDLKEAGMLAYYAERFDTVELNNTFYRMPGESSFEQWAGQVPPGFRFAVKAPRIITHIKRLKDVGEPMAHLYNATAVLGAARGPVLFGLPPNMKQDMDRLRALLALIPDGVRSAIEFRHESWHDDAVFDVLREKNVALCIAQTDEDTTPFVATADWGYLRLRAVAYDAAGLLDWKTKIGTQAWSEAFVYFKHEDEGTGPRFARAFLDLPA
jgi:uncharacterized protein YecE (DUF72 family)